MPSEAEALVTLDTYIGRLILRLDRIIRASFGRDEFGRPMVQVWFDEWESDETEEPKSAVATRFLALDGADAISCAEAVRRYVDDRPELFRDEGWRGERSRDIDFFVVRQSVKRREPRHRAPRSWT